MCDDLDDYTWLFRGVPTESPEVADVLATGEIQPPRPDRIGERWRRQHAYNNITLTGYTSWTTDRSIAIEFARWHATDPVLSGNIVVFRVRIDGLRKDSVYPGRDDEMEFLIQGTIEEVSISEDAADDEEDEDD